MSAIATPRRASPTAAAFAISSSTAVYLTIEPLTIVEPVAFLPLTTLAGGSWLRSCPMLTSPQARSGADDLRVPIEVERFLGNFLVRELVAPGLRLHPSHELEDLVHAADPREVDLHALLAARCLREADAAVRVDLGVAVRRERSRQVRRRCRSRRRRSRSRLLDLGELSLEPGRVRLAQGAQRKLEAVAVQAAGSHRFLDVFLFVFLVLPGLELAEGSELREDLLELGRLRDQTGHRSDRVVCVLDPHRSREGLQSFAGLVGSAGAGEQGFEGHHDLAFAFLSAEFLGQKFEQAHLD